MKLTNILNEIHNQYSTFEFCMDGYIPLSLPLIKKLVKPKRKIVFHITSADLLDNLHRMQGKSKAISTFTKSSKHPHSGPLTGRGMWTDGGCLVVLSGIVLAESWRDLWTVVDESGRRWTKPNNLIHREFEGKVMDYAPKRIKALKQKHRISTLTNKEKSEFITGYINAAYKLLLKNKGFFQKKYNNSAMLPYRENWNELVVSKIKIERIYIIDDLFHEENELTMMGDWALEDYKNTERTQLRKLPSIIKKWGGSIKR